MWEHNHVHLTDADIGFFDSNARLTPPLRSSRDKAAIWEGLQDGTIDAICSDHTPVDDDEKALPFAEASAGATGLELLLSLAIKWSEDSRGEVSLSDALARITCRPATVAQLPCGQIEVGKTADLCVFDPAARWKVTTASIVSQGKHTPFIGYELPALVQHTIVDGRLAYSLN